MTNDRFLGLDLSTQQIKVLVTDSLLNVHSEYNVEFDTDLPRYKTKKGVYSNNGEIHAPVKMWIEALDLVLSRMRDDAFDFGSVRAISGSCQQHGSVYWSSSAGEILSSLDPGQDLVEQITEKAFSLQTAPNWQDHSTGDEIKIFEEYVEGAEELARLTGSRAHYRFTGPQIRKIVKHNPEIYSNTRHISLVSSFLASLFIGAITGIEEADACGMNLYDIGKRQWNEELLAVCAAVHERDGVDAATRERKVNELKEKIGDVFPVGHEPVGDISSYFSRKYGFKPDCKVFSFTGDNLATILALPLNEDELLVSMGTSTTVLLVTKAYIPSSNYHLFIHPTIPDSYMGMICYCNGSLAREKVRNDLNRKFNKPNDDWTLFNQLLESSKGFDEKLGIYFPLGEIVPNKPAQTLRAKYNSATDSIEIVDSWDVEIDVASIVESQALSCRARASPMLSVKDTINHPGVKDLEFDGKIIEAKSFNQRPNKCIYVGGASKNPAILHKYSAILGPREGNFRYDNSNACGIGGAFKATWAYECLQQGKDLNFHEFLSEKFQWGELETIQADDKWEEYQEGLLALNKLENALKD